MTDKSPHNPSVSSPDLQFDRAVPATGVGETATQSVVCGACSATLRTWYYDVDGLQLCAACRQKAERSASPVRDWGATMRALLFGLGAAVAGAAIYYGVIAITNFEIGIVALLIGYMVGFSVRKGAGGRGGRRLQVAAAALTYFSVAMEYLPVALKGVVDGETSDSPTAVVAADSALSEQGEPNAAVTDSLAVGGSTQTNVKALNPVLGIGLLAGFALALPLMVVFGTLPSGLISALIIGIGMRQAWVMTKAAKLTITGPFKVGRAAGGDSSSSGSAASAA
jgi:hypothetical protein